MAKRRSSVQRQDGGITELRHGRNGTTERFMPLAPAQQRSLDTSIRASDLSRLSGIPLSILQSEIKAGRLSAKGVSETDQAVTVREFHRWSLASHRKGQELLELTT